MASVKQNGQGIYAVICPLKLYSNNVPYEHTEWVLLGLDTEEDLFGMSRRLYLWVVVAVFSVWVLARDWYGEEFEKYKPLAAMFGLSYGVLNMFPAFGIPFASIPLALYLLRQIYRRPSAKWYVALFCYPFLSYFPILHNISFFNDSYSTNCRIATFNHTGKYMLSYENGFIFF